MLTPIGSDPDDRLGTYICFAQRAKIAQKKTMTWAVLTRQGGGLHLGDVKWFGSWRQYSFFPQAGCAFEKTCLREIAEFCEARTKEHRSRAS